METFLEYAFIISLFIAFTSAVALAGTLYGKYASPEAKMLRKKLAQVRGLRSADGSQTQPSRNPSNDVPKPFLDFLEKLAESKYLSNLIINSGVKIRQIEIVGIACVLSVFGILVSLFLIKSKIGLLFVFLLPITFGSLPFLFLTRKAKKRRDTFDEKFPEALGLMSRALQAGSGLTTALGMVADELPDPCGPEFKKTFDEINFGIAFNDAISNMAERINSQDFNFFVTALLIQRETGGNLAELLNGLAHTIRERQKLARKVQIISAEGRLSGNVLIALPIIMSLVLSIMNPEYIDLLWTSETGQTSVMFGVVMMIIGAILIRRIVVIKV